MKIEHLCSTSCNKWNNHLTCMICLSLLLYHVFSGIIKSSLQPAWQNPKHNCHYLFSVWSCEPVADFDMKMNESFPLCDQISKTFNSVHVSFFKSTLSALFCKWGEIPIGNKLSNLSISQWNTVLFTKEIQ